MLVERSSWSSISARRGIALKAWKPAHTDNDVTVFDRPAGTLFAGDLCFMEHLPTLDGSLLGWLAQMDALAAIERQRASCRAMVRCRPTGRRRSRRSGAISSCCRATFARRSPPACRWRGGQDRGDRASGRNWALFDEYNERNATAAYAELEWEWAAQL